MTPSPEFSLKQLSDSSTDRFRERLLLLLESYHHAYPSEHETITRYAEFVSNQLKCFHRQNVHGHVTASVWLVDTTKSSVLLTHHRKLDKWLQLGGHADGNGDVHAVALTEAREESGIPSITLLDDKVFDLDIHTIPATDTVAEHLHYDVRFIAQADTDNYIVSEESINLAWVPVADITKYTTETSMVRMAKKWLLSLNVR